LSVGCGSEGPVVVFPSPTIKAVILSLRCPRGQVVVRGVWKRRISCRPPFAHHKSSHPERSAAEPKDLRLPLPCICGCPCLCFCTCLCISCLSLPQGVCFSAAPSTKAQLNASGKGMLQLAHPSPNPTIPNEGLFHLCPSAKGAPSSQPRPSAWVESP